MGVYLSATLWRGGDPVGASILELSHPTRNATLSHSRNLSATTPEITPSTTGKHAPNLSTSSGKSTISVAAPTSPYLYSFIPNDSIPANETFAYAFLIAGCGESNPGYRGFLWGVLVAVEILRTHGSVADMVLMVQMQHADERLAEEHVLRSMRIRLVYIPTIAATTKSATTESNSNYTFYDAVLEKFRILELVEYEKVLFLDADIMPVETQFDYLFTSTDILRPNILRATRGEPANAGFFVLAPGPGKWDRLQEVIDRREIDAIRYPRYRNFDFQLGWGADLRPEGGWKGTHQTGNKYNFWFAAAGTSSEGKCCGSWFSPLCLQIKV